MLTKFWDHLKVFPQLLIPQHGLSRIIFHLARCQQPHIKNFLIKLFIGYFKVDMSLAENPDAESFTDFNHFFTRKLNPKIRPITSDGIVCPVDGSISQIGQIDSTQIFQAKGKNYELEELLAGDDEIINCFQDGLFTTLYLSPRDYHRIHMPLDGKLEKMTYVPGRLFAVNTHTLRVVDSVFSRNERVTTFFETDIGPMAVILVGAIFVGSMETVWAGQITPTKERTIKKTTYGDKDNAVELRRGEELGRFNMGSTVILLFGKGSMNWLSTVTPDSNIIMGTKLGDIE